MQTVNRVERHIILKSHPMYQIVDLYCYKSKNLYNYANYIVRQSFINENTYIPYNKLTYKIKHDEPFKDIGSNSGQHTLKILHQNWKSYFASIKDWSKNPAKYLGKPRLPNYLDKESGRFIWVLTNMQSKIVNQKLVFSFKPLKKYNGLFNTKVTGKHMQTRFIPKSSYYIMEIVYEIAVPIAKESSKRIIGIDLGINNFATIQNNFNEKPFVINGRKLKDINNFYNKELSRRKSVTMKTNKCHWSKKMQILTDKRTNKIDHYLHCCSKYIVDYCIAFKVDTVVIGYNKKWKQKSSLGATNQSFVSIPYQSFVNKMEYKLQEAGIKLILTEESYTSKASFLNNDPLIKGEYNGKRVKRGLYKTNEGTLINADVNAAGNIIKKVFPKAFVDGIEGVGLHPVIVNVI